MTNIKSTLLTAAALLVVTSVTAAPLKPFLWSDWLLKPSPAPQQEKKAPKGNRPNDRFALPPPEFDREYTGEMTIKRLDAEGMREACRGVSVTGCTRRWSDHRCEAYIANDEVLDLYGLSYDAVFRHERAHCLDWHHADESKKRF